MIKVSDYIVKRLAEHGITQAFMVAGGGSMHLNDSFGRSKDIAYLCNHHEQACAMAAEGYARVSGKPAVVVVTSGPGGTNALTGVLGQWLDSVPCIYISGNVKRETSAWFCNEVTLQHIFLRQLGDQEIDIINIVAPVTKFAAVVENPDDIVSMLDDAIEMATLERPGPVWLDIPLDVQSAMIDSSVLRREGCDPVGFVSAIDNRQSSIDNAIELLRSARRPLILAGHGIRIAGAQKELLEFIEKTRIPVVTSFNGMDLIPSDHPLYSGRVGTIGTQAGNAALQSCDLLITIGTRNNIRQVSFDWKNFAPQAKKVVVDIDAAELKKPTLTPDIAINADAGDFLRAMLKAENRRGDAEIEGRRGDTRTDTETRRWKGDAVKILSPRPRVDSNVPASDSIDPYHFIQTLTDLLPEDAVIVSGNGTASICLFQTGKVKKGQRVIMNSGCASMGYDLPAAIGVCIAKQSEIANRKPPIVCITGDGSIQMNIQELQTIAHHQLPIKIFVLNNNGYRSIQLTQDNYFEGRHVGADPESGVSCPRILDIAHAYGIPARYVRYVSSASGLRDILDMFLCYDGAALCEIQLTPDYKFDKQDLSAFLMPKTILGLPVREVEDDSLRIPQDMVFGDWSQL